MTITVECKCRHAHAVTVVRITSLNLVNECDDDLTSITIRLANLRNKRRISGRAPARLG
jgi:hypothetical protein